jgi:hypothetical protein
MKNGRTTRQVTCKLLEGVDEGIIDPKTLLEACLIWMSEADVKEMADANGYLEEEEEG